MSAMHWARRMMGRFNPNLRTNVAVSAIALFAAADAHAGESIDFADATDWSSFALRASEPPRMPIRSDLPFKAISHEGPFSPEREAHLSAETRQLLDLLGQAQWAEALAWLKSAQPALNKRDERGITPLSLCAKAGQLALVREMIRQGAELDQVGAAGMTPLGAAAFEGHDLIVRDLLRAGARTDVPGATGQLPMHLAAATGQTGSMALLRQHGADWTWPNRSGRHVLAEAAYFGQHEAIRWLMTQGAALDAPDRHQLNALHAAALGEQRATVAWLRSQGVPVPHVMSQVLIDQLDTPPATRP